MADRLFLMRHAEAELAPGQTDGDLFSLRDNPLSERGRAQARAARDALADARLDAVYASPAVRAAETARIVAEPYGLPVRTDPDLTEFPFARPGDDYHTVLAAILAFAAALNADADPTFPGGGRFSARKARFARALQDIATRHERPLVVAHGLTNRAWIGDVLGMRPARLLRLAQDHAGVTTVAWMPDGTPVIASLNHCHPMKSQTSGEAGSRE